MTYKDVSTDDPRNADFGKFREGLGERLRQVSAPFANRSEVANSIGVGKSTFQSWVEGRAAPSFEAMARLAQVTNVSPNWLDFGDRQFYPRELVSSHVGSHDWMAIIVNDIRRIYAAKGWDEPPIDMRMETARIYFGIAELPEVEQRRNAIDVVMQMTAYDLEPPQTSDESQRSA